MDLYLTLNTDKQTFFEWLQEHTRDAHEQSYTTERGAVMALGRAEWGDAGCTIAGIGTTLYFPDKGGGYLIRDGAPEIEFRMTPLGPGRLEVVVVRSDSAYFREYLGALLADIARAYPETAPAMRGVLEIDEEPAKTSEQAPSVPKGGRPGLERGELVKRIAYALEAERCYSQGGTTWKGVAHSIGWPFGCDEGGVKLLEQTRQRLKRLRMADPEGILAEAEAEAQKLRRKGKKG